MLKSHRKFGCPRWLRTPDVSRAQKALNNNSMNGLAFEQVSRIRDTLRNYLQIRDPPIFCFIVSIAAEEDRVCRSRGKGTQMKPTVRASRGQEETSRRSGEGLSIEGRHREPRVRVLLFACGGDDAQLMMIYSERIAITYLPSYDLAEVRQEIERCQPKLILCEANVFLDTLPAERPGKGNRTTNREVRTTPQAAGPSVSRRELQILAMLAKGEKNQEIATKLHLSSRTVKRTLSGLFERLQVNNRTELASRVAELSILEHNT